MCLLCLVDVPGRSTLFSGETEVGWTWRREEEGERLGKGDGVNCSQGVMYERRIKISKRLHCSVAFPHRMYF